MFWLALLAWAIADALGIALAFALLVGRAVSRRSAPPTPDLVRLLLLPGLLLARGHPLLTLLLAWLAWFLPGALLLFILL